MFDFLDHEKLAAATGQRSQRHLRSVRQADQPVMNSDEKMT
jgi:hypothetical protein